MADEIQLDTCENTTDVVRAKSTEVPTIYLVTGPAELDEFDLKVNDLLVVETNHSNEYVSCTAVFSDETTHCSLQVPKDSVTHLSSLSDYSLEQRENILRMLFHSDSTQAVSIAHKCNLLEECGELSRGDTLTHFLARHASDMVFSHIFNRLHPSFPFDLRNGESATILQAAAQARNKSTFDGILKLLQAEPPGGQKHTFVNNGLENDDTLLHILAQVCSPRFRVDLSEVVRAGVELEEESDRSRNCFHVAAVCNNPEFMHLIAEALREVHGADETKRTLHRLLARKDSLDKVPAMLATEKDALVSVLRLSNLESQVFDDGRLIHYSAFTNNVMLCNSLVELGAVVDSFNNKSFSALKISSKKGHLEVTRALLEAGANPNLVSKKPGFTALNNAAQFGHLECVQLLIEHGAHTESDDMATTPVHSAAYGGHVKVLEYFLKECNANVNLLNTNGKVPLYQATIQGHSSCVQLLLRQGADVNRLVSDQEETLVHIAVKEGRRQILKALLEHKAKPDEAMKSGKTPLMLAVEQDNVDFIPLIMSYGITLIKKDSTGNTVFHMLAKHGSVKCSKYLLRRVSLISGVTQEYQLYKNKNKSGKSPFDIALENKKEKILEQFIRYMPEQKKTVDQKMFHQLYDKGLYHIIRLIIRELPSHKSGQFQKVDSKFVDSNSDGMTPEDPNFVASKPSFLHKLTSCPDFSLTLHPLIATIINAKYQVYRWWFVFLFLLHFFVFLPVLSFALVQASYTCDANLIQYSSTADYFRLFCETIVFSYCSLTLLLILLNFGSFWHSLYQDSKSSRSSKNRLDVEFLTPKTSAEKLPMKGPRLFQVWLLKSKELLSLLDSKSRLAFTATLKYFFRAENLLGIFGFVFLLILIPLRLTGSPSQWIFATLLFLAYSLSVFRHAKINPTLGLYMSVILRLFFKEVPKFLCVFILLFITSSGALHLVVRYQHSQTAPLAACNLTYHLGWFGETYFPVYSALAPLFLLLNPGLGDGDYALFRDQSVWFVLLYLIFAFVIVVFMTSLFIAQLANAYRAIGSYEILRFKLETIVELERNSFASLVFGRWLRKSTSVMKVLIPKHKWEQVVLNDENSLPTYNSNAVTQETNRQVQSSKELVEKRMEDLTRTTDNLSNNVESMQDSLTNMEQFQTDIQVQLDSIRVAIQHLQQTLVK